MQVTACRHAVAAPSACSKRLVVTVQNTRLNRPCLSRSSVPRLQRARKLERRACLVKAGSDNGAQLVQAKRAVVSEKEGPSTDFKVIWSRLWKVDKLAALIQALTLSNTALAHLRSCLQLTLPYWTKSEDATKARWKLAGVVLLTLGTTGVR